MEKKIMVSKEKRDTSSWGYSSLFSALTKMDNE